MEHCGFTAGVGVALRAAIASYERAKERAEYECNTDASSALVDCAEYVCLEACDDAAACERMSSDLAQLAVVASGDDAVDVARLVIEAVGGGQ